MTIFRRRQNYNKAEVSVLKATNHPPCFREAKYILDYIKFQWEI